MSSPIVRRRVVPSLVAVVVILAGGITATALAADSTPIGTPPSEITPLAATVLAPPRPVPGDDGRIHLAYELFVTNPTTSVMRLQQVDVLSRGDVVDSFAGGRLDTGTRPLGPSPTLDVQPAQVTRVMLDTTVARWGDVPTRLSHRFRFTLTPAGGSATSTTVVSGRSRVVVEQPVVIAPPLSGPRWVTAGGCCFPPSYHRSATLPVNGAFHGPERFAIDFIQLDPANKLFDGPQGSLSSYAYFGSEVRSVANGTVVGLLDGQPEQTPPNFPDGATAETAGGNYVMIDIGDGRFAYYAHMQPGSLRVKVGQRVRRGQVIGLLGNTGNSDAPHMHFQITDGPIPLASEGLPFVFESFTSRGTITNSFDDIANGLPAVIGPATAGPHRRVMPLQDQVIDFPSR